MSNATATVTVKVNKEARAQVDKAAAAGAFAVARQVLETAQARIKRRTGRTGDSGAAILYQGGAEVQREGAAGTDPATPGGEGIIAVVGFDFIGRFLETGTARMGPQPFLGPSVDATDVQTTWEAAAAKEWPKP